MERRTCLKLGTGAAVGGALSAWDAKRYYDSERPITAIRYLMSGRSMQGYGPEGPAGGVKTIAGEA